MKNMEMEEKVYLETQKLLRKNFEFPGEKSVIDLEKLELILSEQIQWLLENRIEKLMQIFYRMDLNENKVRLILDNPSSQTALELARLVIDREMKRAETRIKYSGRF